MKAGEGENSLHLFVNSLQLRFCFIFSVDVEQCEEYGILGCNAVQIWKESDVSEKHRLHVQCWRVSQRRNKNRARSC